MTKDLKRFFTPMAMAALLLTASSAAIAKPSPKDSVLLSQVRLEIAVRNYAVSHNLDLAAQQIGERRLRPGGKFSLNKTLGPRNQATGYKRARSYGGGGTVFLDYGGGLCMLSSALYRVFLKAGLHIDERYPHQRRVSYAAPGFDAAINYGSKDLKVKNNQEHTVYFRVYRQGRFLYAELRGPRTLRKKIDLLRETSKAHIPGSFEDGFRVKTIRRIHLNKGGWREEILSEDVFKSAHFGPAKNDRLNGEQVR